MTTRTDPALRWRPLPEHDRQPFIQPRMWIVHTAVDGPGPTNLGNYFEQTAVTLESHTWLRWDAHEQFMDFDRQADANYKANRFYKDGIYWGAISTETEDDGTPEMRPWNAYQLRELVRFGVWLCRTYGIPPRLCRTWDDRGIGYHCQFPGRWTNVKGKSCPGDVRIHQLTTIVIPRIQAELNQGEDPLAALSDAEQRELIDFVRAARPWFMTLQGQINDIDQDVEDWHNEALGNDDDPDTVDRLDLWRSTLNVPSMLGEDREKAEERHAELMTALGDIADALKALLPPPEPEQ